MKNDGTQAVRVTKDKAKFITVCEGWLYYCAPAAGLHFYKCRTDGSERTLLYKTSMSAFTVVGDLIYMETVSSSQRLHVLKTDGTGYTRISDQKVMSPFYYRGALYSCAVRHSKQLYAAYPNSDGEGYTYKKTGNLRATSIVIYNDTVYYANSADSDRLYAADIDGGNARKIADITVADINICNGYLYFQMSTITPAYTPAGLTAASLKKLDSRAYCGDLSALQATGCSTPSTPRRKPFTAWICAPEIRKSLPDTAHIPQGVRISVRHAEKADSCRPFLRARIPRHLKKHIAEKAPAALNKHRFALNREWHMLH